MEFPSGTSSRPDGQIKGGARPSWSARRPYADQVRFRTTVSSSRRSYFHSRSRSRSRRNSRSPRRFHSSSRG